MMKIFLKQNGGIICYVNNIRKSFAKFILPSDSHSIFIKDMEFGDVECCCVGKDWYFNFKSKLDIKIIPDDGNNSNVEVFFHVQSFKIGYRTFTLPV